LRPIKGIFSLKHAKILILLHHPEISEKKSDVYIGLLLSLSFLAEKS